MYIQGLLAVIIYENDVIKALNIFRSSTGLKAKKRGKESTFILKEQVASVGYCKWDNLLLILSV